MVVAGAGPVGLFLAGELALAGVSVLVIERLAEPSETIKAGSVGPQSVELFDRRGLLAPLREASAAMFASMAGKLGSPAPGPATPNSPVPVASGSPAAAGPTSPPISTRGHFSGLWILRGGSGPRFRTPALAAPQQLVERVLKEHVDRLGVPVRRSHELVDLDADQDGVRITCRTDAGDVVIHAGHLVGCDGGRSTVRKLAGFDFPGTAPTITGRQAAVVIAEPNPLRPGWHRTERGMVVFGPGPNRVLTVEFDGPPADRDTLVTAEEIQASLRRVSGTDVTVTALLSGTRWTDNTRQADSYRRGRVLLAGDAAHVHPPFGGQGLNLGFQDAANLGWKLAAEIAGWAPEGLLDSYTEERHPVAARALENTRAQVALMRPDPQTTALRELFTELLAYDEPNAHVTALMGSLDMRYPVGWDQPSAGHPVADRELLTETGTVRLFDLQRDARAVLVDASGTDALASIALPWADRVRLVRATPTGADDLESLLVRPDGIVAWAAPAGSAEETAGLAESLRRWFGKA